MPKPMIIFLIRIALAIGIIVGLTHCSSAPQKISVKFPLETRAKDEKNHSHNLPPLQQQWWVTYHAKSYPLQVYLEPNLPHWKMVIVNNLGQRLITVDSQNKQPLLGEAHHPLRAIYADLINAAHWSFWPRDYLIADSQGLNTDKRWEFRELGARRDIYFSGILQASFEALDQTSAATLDPVPGFLGRSTYKAYARNGHLAFEIAIQSSPAE